MPPAIELQILRAGDGQYYPKQGETVAVHYTVSLSNGKEVDNTYKRGQPFRFKVSSGQVVKGWDEAVKQLIGRAGGPSLVQAAMQRHKKCSDLQRWGHKGLLAITPSEDYNQATQKYERKY